MQIPILSGITGGKNAEFAVSYPVNLEPVIVDSKISKGQLRSAHGVEPFGEGPGLDRGGINWNGTLYRVMGSKLVTVSTVGAVTVLGEVGDDGRPVAFDYSFDRLGIASAQGLYYWDGDSLAAVTDPDLGNVLDMIWVDGYWMTTDGNYIVVTELSDPSAIDPLKYGSAEADPDMIVGLIKYREEVYALGRHTIQVFQNVGTSGFPFAAVRGATIPYGCVSASAKCLFADSFAFVGSARGEPVGVYIAGQGNASKVSTKEIDELIAEVADPATIVLENRAIGGQRRLVVHLDDKALILPFDTSNDARIGAWYIAQSGQFGTYRPRYAVDCYGKSIVGDRSSSKLGFLSDAIGTHWGDDAQWRFDVGMVYNEGRGFIMHSMELVGLPGRERFGEQSSVFMSVTRDGMMWSNEAAFPLRGFGAREQRLFWRPRTRFGNYMSARFRGSAHIGFARLEAQIEGLTV